MEQSRKRIVVTGGSGQIGRYVIRHLADQGHQVINIDQRPRKDSPARHVYLDLRRRELLQPVLEGADAVIHLGEIPNAGRLADDETFTHNTAAAATVLQTSADLGISHVVYTSTCQVYGTWGAPRVPPLFLPMTEDHPVQPRNAYGLSKAANEMYAAFAAREHGLSVSIFRLPAVMSPDREERLLRWFEREWSVGKREEMGTYLHVSDVATAYAAAIDRMLPGCHTYHLTAADVALRQPLRDYLAENEPTYPKLPLDWPDFKSPLILDRARDELGWTPQWTVRDRFKQLTGKDFDAAA